MQILLIPGNLILLFTKLRWQMQWTEVARMTQMVRVTHGQTPCSLLCPTVSIPAVPTSHGQAQSVGDVQATYRWLWEKGKSCLFSLVLRPPAQRRSRSQTSAGAMATLHHPAPLPQPRLLQKLCTRAVFIICLKSVHRTLVFVFLKNREA